MQVKDELRVLVEAEVARAIENLKKFSGEVEQSEQKSLSLGEALDSLSKKSLIISGVLGGAGIAAIKFAGENEKLKLSLKNMLGSADEASVVFEEWRRLGSSPGLSSDEVFSLGKAMINMGHDTEYATSTMTMLGNVAAGTGVSFSEISSSFERTRAVGNLTTRDLVKLQQQGIPIVKQLAKEMGISEESVKNLAANGKISFADFERALKSMTGPGGQFAGMMDELSGTVLEKFSSAADNAKQALASFGEMLLPLATDLLSGVSSLMNGIMDMDDGTKRFVIGMGGVVVAAPPAIAAIRGIGSALAFVAANPIVIGIGAAVAAAAVLAGLINKQAHAYDDLNKKVKETDTAAKSLLSSFADGNEEKLLDAKTTAELIKLYPELSKVIKANNTTVREAAELQQELNKQKVVDAQSSRIKKLQEERQEYIKLLPLIEEAEKRYKESLTSGDQYQIESYLDGWENLKADRDEILASIRSERNEINEILASVGKEMLASGAIIDLKITPKIAVDTTEPEPSLVNLKKTWQEWFGEIANIDPKLFGNNGAKAAELYIADFERGLSAQKDIAKALGEKLDIASMLRSRQSDVQNALVEMFSIDPDQINKPFKLMNPEIKKLIESYEELGKKAKELEDIQKRADTLKELWSEVGNLSKEQLEPAIETLKKLGYETEELTKDKYDLALASLAAAGATDEEIKKAEDLIKVLREARDETGKLKFDAKEFFGNMASNLASISLSSLNGELFKMGEAFAKGEFAMDNLTDALSNMAMQILNQLPNMFLQAGLQLISQGQWALGLGFVVAAGASSLISGYVSGKTDTKKNSQSDYHPCEITPNAHGNAFNAFGIVPYAYGGAFTNQIVNHPTYFRYGGRFGVMGEAGPESIMPLRRMSNGDLGVAASGGGGEKVTVNIINNSGADVRKEETENADGGKDITVIIGDMINNHITSGRGDRAMSRFGVRPAGV